MNPDWLTNLSPQIIMPGVYVFVDGLVLYTHIFPQILHYAHTYITPVRFVNTYMYSYAHYRHIYIYNR